MSNKIIGSPGKITVKEDEAGNFIIDIDPTYGGQVSINTVGSITTGLWRGYTIEPEYGGTGCSNTGVISASGDVTITGSLSLICNPELQSVLKIPENEGTVALKEESLQTNNCFSEFSDEQAIKAFDEIAPTFEKGQIIAHNGKQNAAINVGKNGEFLGVNFETQMPEFQPLPNIYSYVLHQSKKLPLRDQLNFNSNAFYISDNKGSTSIRLHEKLEQILDIKPGLFVIGQSSLATRTLESDKYIKISNKDFVEGNPCISLSDEYPGQESIKTLGKIESGEWNAKIIKPEFGGTGCANKAPIEAEYGMILQVPFVVTNANKAYDLKGALVLTVYDDVSLKVYDSGTVATSEKTLQRHNNLKDIQEPLEAFRHISPTKKRGDIIIRGYGDYDTVVEAGNNGELLVADSSSDQLVSYKHPRDIESIREYVNEVFDTKLEEAKQDLKRVLKMYEEYESKMCKRIDNLCAQFDYMSHNKQINLIKELKDELRDWTQEKVNKCK